ncbi:MAG: sigma-70 family RNA polymerase sigma factor [Cyclobacteriaceae bacterium]|nr:sigma-70 family RNA polymerase sigma factor [Cyclobacteriaceae bacterium]
MTPELDPENWLPNYGDYLYSYCLQRVNHPETAEDIVQETLVAALRAKDGFKGESSEATWLVAILKNKITDFYRKKDVLKEAGDYLESTEKEFSEYFFDASNGHWLREAAPQSWSDSADAGLEKAEFDQVLRKCLEKMPPKLAPVFIARFFDDEDSETICKVHRISPSNYWVIMHRAKLLLRACLERNWFLSASPK